jgi:sec-independent protein translocase protein TatC
MSDPQPMTFWDHLDELRRRLLRSLLFIVLAAVAGFVLSERAQTFLIQPFIEFVPGSLTLLAPGEGFVIQIKISLMLGVLIAAPLVAWQMYGFVGPGLRKKEKLWLFPIVIASSILFWGGVIFAWQLMPAALGFLGSFAEVGIQNLWSLKSYINLILFLLLAFGTIFQLPLVMSVLMATGLVSSKFFRKYRRYAIVIIFIVSAIATPTTDAVTMMLMVGPMMVLYEASIWVGILIERKRAKRLAMDESN